jgi:type II secretory pathway component GspD/PulD (secretin)
VRVPAKSLEMFLLTLFSKQAHKGYCLCRGTRTIFSRYLVRWVYTCVIFGTLFLGGCEFFELQQTERETERILKNLGRVRIESETQPRMPETYKQPAKIITTKKHARLFYFARYHTADELAKLLTAQSAVGIALRVSTNPATNQLVVNCSSEAEAEEVLAYIEQIDVEPVQVRIDCIISELFADLTLDYETTLDIQNLFGERIAVTSKLPGASMRALGRGEIGLKVGISRRNFDALIDLLESRGYAKILMNPSVEVVNGKKARIETKERVPIKEQLIREGVAVETIKYQDVIDYLEVTPHVFADGSIGLETKAGVASRAIPEGATQAPIITTRDIQNEANRIRPGESLVIGGIRKTEHTSIVRGVPFLKDIPLLGLLFTSKDFEERSKEILFIITPYISTGGTPRRQIERKISEEHTPLNLEMPAEPAGGAVDLDKPGPFDELLESLRR